LLSNTFVYGKYSNDHYDYTDAGHNDDNNKCGIGNDRYSHGRPNIVPYEKFWLYLYGQSNDNRLHDGWIHILSIDWHRLLFVVGSRKTRMLHSHNNNNYTTDYDSKNNTDNNRYNNRSLSTRE
jgi:hypothetical protein